MTTTTSSTTRRLTLLAAVVAAIGLAACGREDDARTAGERVDDTVGQVDQRTDTAQERIAEGAAEIKQDAQQATTETRDAVHDAAITAAVNAELARDSELSALKIDVDTVGGRVALKGTAPNEAARERATQLAQGVDGVSAVENQLLVQAS